MAPDMTRPVQLQICTTNHIKTQILHHIIVAELWHCCWKYCWKFLFLFIEVQGIVFLCLVLLSICIWICISMNFCICIWVNFCICIFCISYSTGRYKAVVSKQWLVLYRPRLSLSDPSDPPFLPSDAFWQKFTLYNNYNTDALNLLSIVLKFDNVVVIDL